MPEKSNQQMIYPERLPERCQKHEKKMPPQDTEARGDQTRKQETIHII